MRWWKLKNIYFDHPYFDYTNNTLSEAEAECVFNTGFPTFDKMVKGAKKRFDMPPEAWADFDKVIAERASTKRQWKMTKRIGAYISQHRRLAIVCLAVVLIVSFFTLVPFGRALAASLFDMIMRVIEGRIEVTSQNPDYDDYNYVNLTAEQYNKDNIGDSESTYEKDLLYYPDIERFVKQTGLAPVTLKTDWLTCQTIQSLDDKDLGITLTVQYLTRDGLYVVVTQRWGLGKDIVFRVEGATYNKTIIFGNKELFYTTDPVDGSFVGTALLDDSLLIIGAENGIDTGQLINAMK